MQANNTEFVKNAIKNGFRSLCEISYMKVCRGTWYSKLSRANQLLVGRGVFTMRDITLDPDAHFLQHANGVDGLDAAFWKDEQMRARLNCFYGEVKDWYKHIKSQDAQSQAAAAVNASNIIAMSKRINDDFIAVRDGVAILYINKFFDNPIVRRVLLGQKTR